MPGIANGLLFIISLSIGTAWVLPIIAQAEVCQELRQLIDGAAGVKYKEDRSFVDYMTGYGKRYVSDVIRLNGNSRMLELGPGVGEAVSDYMIHIPLEKQPKYMPGELSYFGEVIHQLQARPFQDRARVLAIGYHAPRKPAETLLNSGRLQFWDDEFLENVPLEKMINAFGSPKKYDIAQDFFGPLAYGENPAENLFKVMNALEDGAPLYMTVGYEQLAGNLRRHTVRVGGRTISFVDWIRSLPELQVETVMGEIYTRGTNVPMENFRITKKPGVRLGAPPKMRILPGSKIETVDADGRPIRPPIRHFEILP